MFRAPAVFCLGFLFLFITGCSGGMGKVTGQVNLDGTPLPTGDISFLPDGPGTPVTGRIASGNYSLKLGTDTGIPPGKYKVAIVAVEAQPVTPGQPELPPKLLTPAKYNNVATSGLTAEVKPGSNSFKFDLVSTP